MAYKPEHLTKRYLNIRYFQLVSSIVVTIGLFITYYIGSLHNFKDYIDGDKSIYYSKLKLFIWPALLNIVYIIFLAIRLKKFRKEVLEHLNTQK